MNVPANGWTLQEMDHVLNGIDWDFCGDFVFVSPIPYLIKILSLRAAMSLNFDVYVFHNDNREKKELPNGKVISVVASEGWQLV